LKDKLHKHRYSVFFAYAWSLTGLAVLFLIAYYRFPFYENNRIDESAIPLLVGASIVYLFLSVLLSRLRSHPTSTNQLVVIFVCTAFGLALFMVLAAAREYFSLSFLAAYIVFINVWFSIEFSLRRRLGRYFFAVVPGGIDLFSDPFPNCTLIPFPEPKELPKGIDGLIIDFTQPLSEAWLAFVSKCILEGVPVISVDDFIETEKGLIILEHLNTARTIAFQRNQIYVLVKQVMDQILVLVTLPLWMLIALVAGIAIRLESPGPVLFSQLRIGKRGRPFRIYKFRSMRYDSEKDGVSFAKEGDDRITRVGAVIRKFRIDEIPQFWNVLRGDMSLIGPRPEQVPFVEQFEKSIPYYQLRHIVRPGITGWAQVTRGYAASEAQTADKLAADLYYVKRLSFSLDFLIMIKTLWTILTGFGAR
jgi:UDP-GalNAc:undecaprenyl-phosphate GalNAc-1-phosphate transferase